jgi:hypothetical protein
MKAISYFEKPETPSQEAYIKLQCNCVFCNAPLEFKFENLDNLEIKEEANCPECEIRTRNKLHLIQ